MKSTALWRSHSNFHYAVSRHRQPVPRANLQWHVKAKFWICKGRGWMLKIVFESDLAWFLTIFVFCFCNKGSTARAVSPTQLFDKIWSKFWISGKTSNSEPQGTKFDVLHEIFINFCQTERMLRRRLGERQTRRRWYEFLDANFAEIII